MTVISLQDKNFRSGEDTTKYKISIRVSLNGFSYLISDIATESYKAYYSELLARSIIKEDFQDKLSEFFFSDIFDQNFAETHILLGSPQSMLLPSAVFDENSLKLMYETNYCLEEDEMLQYSKIADMYLVYPLASFTSSVIENRFAEKNIFHSSYPILRNLLARTKHSLETMVFVEIENGYFTVFVIKKSTLVLYNSYSYKNVNDYIFFLMNVFEQLKLNPITTKVYLSGRVSKESAYFHSAATFIKYVELSKPDADFERKAAGLIDKIQYHNNSNLFLL